MRTLRVCLLVLLATLMVSGCGRSRAQGGADDAQVIKVLDGDSLLVMRAGDKIEVRLRGIDAPEQRQPYAREAKSALVKLAAKRTVALTVIEKDRYGREVAVVVRKKDGLNINRQLVEDGHAWVYTRYATDKALPRLERAAREAQRGLWALSGDQRVPPWEWRKIERARKN